jgi:hypothetical protein
VRYRGIPLPSGGGGCQFDGFYRAKDPSLHDLIIVRERLSRS